MRPEQEESIQSPQQKLHSVMLDLQRETRHRAHFDRRRLQRYSGNDWQPRTRIEMNINIAMPVLAGIQYCLHD